MTRRATMAPFGALGLGDTTDWKQVWSDPAEVYLWRAFVHGAELADPSDAQLLLRAVAKSATELGMDVRGIVVGPTGMVDVVLTTDVLQPYVLPPDAADVRIGALADPQLRARYPQIDLQAERFLQLTGPPASVDFWRAHATVWDDKVGPLDAFAKMQGIYRGPNADAGPGLAPWTVSQPPLETPPPKPTTTSGWATPTLVFLAGALFLAGGAWALMPKERAR
jgi:hypothetical protein